MTGFKNILLLGFALLVVACAPQAPEKSEPLPDWIIPEAKMVDVLTDVHIIEGARIGTKVLGDSLPVQAHYKFLWQKHKISPELYDSSFRFYSRNAERMDKMYEEVLTRLTKVSTRVDAPEGSQSSSPDKQKENTEKTTDSTKLSDIEI